MTAEIYFTVVIETDDPHRYLPASWQIIADDPAEAWRKALEMAAAENVGVVRILDEHGREVFD